MSGTSAATEIIESHEGIQSHVDEATCAALHLVFDPHSDDAEAQAREVWRFIVHEALPHMDYEEKVLYPRVVARGVPPLCVELLRDEHETLRRIAEHLAETQLGADALRSERALLLLRFVQAFEKHAAREDAVLALFTDHFIEH